MDRPRTIGKPAAIILVTQNLSSGGADGMINNSPVGVRYDGAKWSIFNEDLSNIPIGASFNVVVLSASSE